MGRFPFYKNRAARKKALELEACRAENDALRAENDALQAQLSELMRLYDSDTTKKTDFSAEEVQSLRDDNERLALGARRDSETIKKLAHEIRTLASAAAEVVNAAKTCQPKSKGSRTLIDSIDHMWLVRETATTETMEWTSGDNGSSSVESSMGTTTVGTTAGTSRASSVGSTTESSAKSSQISSARSSVGCSGGSSESSMQSSMGTVRSAGSSAVSSVRLKKTAGLARRHEHAGVRTDSMMSHQTGFWSTFGRSA
jgi:hypothetical protein